MNLLVVDDQVSVVEGIANGIDWKSCGFGEVFCAYSVVEAKQFLTRYSIDVMLCDIEMPYESGIDLLKWINRQELIVKCIMLTAHAEFAYAQQALKLGSVDYILQPAAYEDIRSAVMSAVDEINRNKLLYTLSDIGQSISDHGKNISGALFFSILEGKSTDYDFLHSLGLFPDKDQPFWLVSFQVIRWKHEHWREDQLLFAIDNVCEELLSPYRQQHLVTLTNDNTCTVVVWSTQELISQLLLSRQMEFFASISEQYDAFDLAIYINKGEQRSQIHEVWKELSEMITENVMLSTGVFLEKRGQSSKYSFIYRNRWLDQLKDGYGKTTRFEAKKFLSDMDKADILTMENLKRFYSDLLHVFFGAAGTEINLMEKVLLKPADFDLYYNAYESVESMEALIDRIIDVLSAEQKVAQVSVNVVEAARQFIQEHIRDELHRDDVAAAVHLNSDYLSKLFKKEFGLSLKEYILDQKMKHAKVLLLTTSLPVGIVATMVGYDNFSHFSQTYKRIIGERPMDTRST